jgi:hypothetical protein
MFSAFKSDLEISATETMYPSRLRCVGVGRIQLPEKTSHYFGWILTGRAQLELASGLVLPMESSMYFSSSGGFQLESKGEVVLFERLGYRGLFQVGGPVEADGRLCYIDNCRTTILVPPPRMGDPVFNYLVFPPKTEQTMHLHPTLRLGVVIDGSGECVTPASPRIPLTKGDVFCLPEGYQHCFYSGPQGMKVIAYHPDSDTGPTDQDHPMLNRTYIKPD